MALYAPMWPPAGAANGVVTYVAAIARFLTDHGHAVSIVTEHGVYSAGSGHAADLAIARPLPVLRTLRGLWDRKTGDTRSAAARIAATFKGLHRAQPIDIIEMEESFGWFSAVARATGVPLVVRLHGPHFLYPEWMNREIGRGVARRRNAGELRGLAGAQAITAPSETTLNAACARVDCSEASRAVIPNPVAATAPDERWSTQEADPDLLLWVGRFDRLKGADRMLAAFAGAVQQRPQLQLELVGPDRGFVLDSGESLTFEAYCARFIKPETLARVRFRGLLTPAEIAALRKQAALTLVTSRRENFPYAAVEAMAVGAPLVATRWEGIEELLEDGTTAWLAAPDDSEALTATILSALADPHERERRGREAWRFCRDRLSTEEVGRQTLSFYQSVLDRRADSR